MLSYSAFGLGIRSEIPLPELIEVEGDEDILIRYGRVERPMGLDPDDDDYFRLADDTVSFHTPHGGFRIASGRELTVDPSHDSSPASVRLTILGRALGAMLQWRGQFVLHASAVARNGRAIAFAGESGAGKSTTAATFLRNGYSLVADDIVAIDTTSPGFQIFPGLSHMKLWPDSAAAHGHDHEALDRIHEAHDKRYVPLSTDQIVGGPVPLDAIYMLASGTETHVVPLNAQDALVCLLRNAYAPRIMRVLGRQGEHLEQSARIAAVQKTAMLVIDRNSCKHSEVLRVIGAR
ncbi:MAG: hypothetical protein H7X80_04000 [bacterium]|nr:hypothetical protein [Candidatus Kapabacteria bacterium]